jgi:hypothetical protein
MLDTKTMPLAGNRGTLLSVLSLPVFLVGASEFMLAAMLSPSVAPSAPAPFGLRG